MWIFGVKCTDCEKEYLVTVAALDVADAELIAQYVMEHDGIHSDEMGYDAFGLYPTQYESGYFDTKGLGYAQDAKYFDTIASPFLLLNTRQLRIDEILSTM